MRVWWLECRRAFHFRSGRWGGESCMPGMLEVRCPPRRIASAVTASHCVAHDHPFTPRLCRARKAAIDIAAACSSAFSRLRSPRDLLSHPMHPSTPPRAGEAMRAMQRIIWPRAPRRTTAQRWSPPRTPTRRWAALSVSAGLCVRPTSTTFRVSYQTVVIALVMLLKAPASGQGSRCLARARQRAKGRAALVQHAAMVS